MLYWLIKNCAKKDKIKGWLKVASTVVRCCVVILIGFGALLNSAQAQDAGPESQARAIAPEPRARSYEWMSLAQWYRTHADQIEQAQSAQADVLFLGDSITASWEWGPEQTALFDKYFGSYKTANFAIGGDRAENLLWRLQNGLRGKLEPKVVVSLIGVNNIGQTQQSPATINATIAAVVDQIHDNYPQAQILLLGVLPFGADPAAPTRKQVEQLNQYLSQLDERDYLSYYDFGAQFIDQNGRIPATIMADELHLTPAGLDRFAQVLAPKIDYALDQYGRQSQWVVATDPKIEIMGRYAVQGKNQVLIGFPGVSLDVHFNAKKVSLLAQAEGEVYFDVLLDGIFYRTIEIAKKPQKIALFEATNAAPHHLKLIKRTETWQGRVSVMGIEVRDGDLLEPPALPARKLLIIGDSISCGEGVARPAPSANSSCDKQPLWWDAKNSYGYKLAAALDAQVQLVCYGGRGLVRDWEGKTEPLNVPEVYQSAVPLEPEALPWQQQDYQADLILAMIGTNDFSQSAGEPPAKTEYTQRYLSFLKQLLADHPQAQIVITDGPMLTNEDQNTQHKSLLLEYLYQAKSLSKSERVHVIPTRTISGDSCDDHPNAAAHQTLAEDFEPLVRNIMGWAEQP